MDNYNIFIVINYKDKKNEENQLFSRTRVNNNNINSSKYLICGGVYNRKGGNVIFTAKNLQEVKQVTVDKPLLKNVNMKYNIAVIPKKVTKDSM